LGALMVPPKPFLNPARVKPHIYKFLPKCHQLPQKSRISLNFLQSVGKTKQFFIFFLTNTWIFSTNIVREIR
jgi:hypothetical protein